MREVVITGMGIVSSLGIGLEAVLKALETGRSGVRTVPELAAANHPIPIAGDVVDFDAKAYVKPRKALKVMSRETQLAFAAAELAWDAARLEGCGVDPERLGVTVGSNMFCPEVVELDAAFHACKSGDGAFNLDRWGDRGLAEMFPLWLLKYLPNMAPCHVGIAHDARGPSNSVVAGDTSGLLAVIEAADVVARDHADVMLTGGASSMLGMMDVMWHAGARLSRSVAEPERASRPFDAKRDGIVGGEGAAILVLEAREHAVARGASILGAVRGYGRRHEDAAASHRPTGRSIRGAIAAALATADATAADVGCVSAFGASTENDDRIEAQAIAATLGDVPVTALKSRLGHAGAGCGAIELVAALASIRCGTVPATLNYETPDPACPANVAAQACSPRSPLLMALSHRITGQAVALAVEAQ